MSIKAKHLDVIMKGKGKQVKWDSKPYKSKNGLSLLKSNTVTDILTDEQTRFKSLTKDQLNKIIDEKLGNKFFLTKEEKQEEVKILRETMWRYIVWEKKQNREIIHTNLKRELKINGESVYTTAHLSFKNEDGSVEIVKFKNKTPEYSKKAKKNDKKAILCNELYCMYQMGKLIYPENKIIVSYYYMKSKRDVHKEMRNIYNSWLNGDSKEIESETLNYLLLASTSVNKREAKKWKDRLQWMKSILNYEGVEGSHIVSVVYDTDLENQIVKLINSPVICDECETNCRHHVICKHKFEDNQIELVKEIKKTNKKFELTPNQKDVVENTMNGIYRINSVAGSGKTASMVDRYCHLLKQGVKPSQIFCTTFTNAGASELKERIVSKCNEKGIRIFKRSINIYTFNSFGSELIKKEWVRLGFKNKPDIASKIDCFDIIKILLNKYDKFSWIDYRNPNVKLKNYKGIFYLLYDYFNKIKLGGYIGEGGKFYDEVISKEGEDEEALLQKTNDLMLLFSLYNKELYNSNRIDYSDQVLYCSELFTRYPELIQKYGYQHLVIDESQDTNLMQENVIRLLTQYNSFKSLVIVGDNDQAIYSFMYTSPEMMLNFHKRFDNVQDKFLTDNFRSTPKVCDLANKLIKLNKNRTDKNIKAYKPSGEPVLIQEYKTLADECEGIYEGIFKDNMELKKLHDMAIIARNKKELLEVQETLKSHNIPCELAVSERFIDNLSVQHIINLTEFFENTEVDYPLFENMWITSDEFKELSNEEQQTRVQQVKEYVNLTFENCEETDKINYFNDFISDILKRDEVACSFIKKVNEKIYYTFHEYASQLKKYMLYKDDTKIEKIEKENVKRNCVTLTTAHSSKGKEWKSVYVMLDGFKKHKDDVDLTEEERRLLFVAITRAKDVLTLSYNTKQDKKKDKGKVGDFVEEVKELME